MKVRRREEYTATKLPVCGNADISDKWMIVDPKGGVSYVTDEQFKDQYELCRKPRKQKSENAPSL